jgi:hypothetical protein
MFPIGLKMSFNEYEMHMDGGRISFKNTQLARCLVRVDFGS